MYMHISAEGWNASCNASFTDTEITKPTFHLHRLLDYGLIAWYFWSLIISVTVDTTVTIDKNNTKLHEKCMHWTYVIMGKL